MKDVIIACDFANKTQVLDFLSTFKNHDLKPFVKIGMELFYGEGPDIVRLLKDGGYKIFLDLKLHDIPNTVRKSMKNIAQLGVDMTNVHALGTRNMMQAAKEGLEEGSVRSNKTKLVAITQLTSTSPKMLKEELLIKETMEEVIISYAKNAKNSGLDGVVCSPLEAASIKQSCGDDFLAVTPGIRYLDGSKDDQHRITTPNLAASLGADYIVVGRPITAASDPVASYLRVVNDFLHSS